ncbi:hypothetical protein CTAM01_00870 [Colletotrichum tamarilloi]|uniref:Uncharacterized protein n=1 Tax=Colletotrichum tamarilloi TaxID=1209934 RepID=A0ABQ9RT70_9PEZI|nr:uncharacterized protein CTAM01_00870 [Colletotrichum tamarilloi]KAK1511940.1 hypothetical protein CTAM01_00870 [Colletotrichum tamarilloi]
MQRGEEPKERPVSAGATCSRFCRTASAARSAVRRVSVLSVAGEHLGLGGERSLSFCLVGAAAAHHTMGQGRWAKTAKGLASMKRAPAMAAFDIAQIPHLHNHRSEGGDDYAMKCLRLSRGSEPKHLRWRPPKTRAQGWLTWEMQPVVCLPRRPLGCL